MRDFVSFLRDAQDVFAVLVFCLACFMVFYGEFWSVASVSKRGLFRVGLFAGFSFAVSLTVFFDGRIDGGGSGA